MNVEELSDGGLVDLDVPWEALTPGRQSGGPSLLEIRLGGETLVFERRKEVSHFPGSRTWVGRAQRVGEDALITVYEDRVAGYLNADGLEVSIRGPLEGPWELVLPGEDSDEDDGSLEEQVGALRTGGVAPMPTVSLTGGPIPSGHDVIDLLVVFGDPAINYEGSAAGVIASAISGVATAQQAFDNSDVDVTLRLLDLLDIGWDSSGHTCDARIELETNNATYGADGVDDLRDQYGADMIVGIIGNEATSTHPCTNPGDTSDPLCQPTANHGGTGCGLTPHTPGVSTADTNEVVVVRSNYTDHSLRHEMGHNLGLKHGRDEYLAAENVEDYAYGQQWPNDLEVSSPAGICSDEPFRTVMAKVREITIGGVKFDTNRKNHFADPDLDRTVCAGTDTVPWGSTATTSFGTWAAAADRLRETVDDVAAYRPAQSYLTGAELTSPAEGSAVSGSQTFTWTATSPVGAYWLEVYDPATSTVYADLSVSTTSHTVSSLPASTPLAVRLWTDLSDTTAYPQWVWVDHRLSTAATFVGCSDDPSVAPGGTTYDAYDCTDSSGAVCSVSGTELTCDLERGTGTAYGLGVGVAAFHGIGQSYDLAFWGQGDNGEGFCCLYHDAAEALTQVELVGSSNDDVLDYRPSGEGSMGLYGSNALTAALSGGPGADTLDGSSRSDSGYTEFLRGQNGSDTLYGNGGPDELRGGAGDDYLEGGAGADVLIAGAGSDELAGDEQADVLCTQNADDLLQAGASSGDTLYISSVASGTVHPNNTYGLFGSCGHTTWSLPCTYATLTAAPAACATVVAD